MMPAAVYELDHLITLAVNTPQGLSLEDGLRQLCDTEAKGGGIWALRVEMQIDEQHQQLVIVDKAAAVEIDKMMLSSISDINSSGADKRAAYSNVLAINVLTDDGANRLHLFMCCNDQASDVAANIRLAKQGQSVRSHSKPIGSQKKSGDSDNDKFIPVSNNFKQDEIIQHNVKMFNHCLDDIEKFVALLQEAARNYSYSQPSSFGYPISATTNKEPSLPSARDLVDILKKFKMAFNLLCKLQGVLRDPNADELAHFLFSTLTLVVETSRDPANGQLTLASNVVSPLFSRATLDFLNNTVTAKERDLLRSLGDAWNISRESWQGYVPPFFPSFRNGFQPPPSWLDDKPSTGIAVPLRTSQQPAKSTNSHASNGYERQDSGFKDETDNEIARMSRNGSVSFEQSLRQKGADVAEVTSTRMGSNDKELTIREGEILEILDSSRNWWHARNSVGLTGYVPYTALKRLQ